MISFVWMLNQVRNSSLNLRIERCCNMFLTRHVSSKFFCKTVALPFTVNYLLCCVCVLSHSFPCSFRPYRAPSPNLPHHSVSAPPVSQGYKHSLYPLLPPQISSRIICPAKQMVHLSKNNSLKYQFY